MPLGILSVLITLIVLFASTCSSSGKIPLSRYAHIARRGVELARKPQVQISSPQVNTSTQTALVVVCSFFVGVLDSTLVVYNALLS